MQPSRQNIHGSITFLLSEFRTLCGAIESELNCDWCEEGGSDVDKGDKE